MAATSKSKTETTSKTTQAEEQKHIKTNYEWIKEKIRPNAVDAFEIMNTCLSSKKKRAKVAGELFNDQCQCRLCYRPEALREEACPYYRLSLGNCRIGILKWMEMPVGSSLSEEEFNKMEEEG